MDLHPENMYIVINDYPKVENLRKYYPAMFVERSKGRCGMRQALHQNATIALLRLIDVGGLTGLDFFNSLDADWK